MNIFYLHRCPVKAANIQYNKHVVKMILESAQMLCTAHHHYAPFGMPDGEFTEPPQCMPDQYKVPDCSITAYWNYYEGEKYLVANKDELLITRDKLYDKKKDIRALNWYQRFWYKR